MTVTTTSKRGLCLNDYPDLRDRAAAAADTYASTDDGGYPGTHAAITYRTETDAVWAIFSRRLVTLVRTVNGISS